ncbi:MAG: hypothetical protein RLZZ546_2521, partial [Bacteroidota bacterium]
WEIECNSGYYSKKITKGKSNPAFVWVWAQQGEMNLHAPEKWGHLIFKENNLEIDLEEIQQIEDIKWLLRQYYFDQKKQNHKRNLLSKKYQEIKITSSGRSYAACIDFKNHRYCINEEGRVER